MSQPIPVYLDPIDHDAIEAEIDRQMGIETKPKRERAWDCLAGEAPIVCGHARISRSTAYGLTDVVCLTCAHEWIEVMGEP